MFKNTSKWVKLLLSDSSLASVRRVISLVSFIEMLIIANVALFNRNALPNVTLIIVCFNLFATICLIGIFALTATDVAKIIKHPPEDRYHLGIDNDEDIYKPGADDPFDIENTDAGKPK